MPDSRRPRFAFGGERARAADRARRARAHGAVRPRAARTRDDRRRSRAPAARARARRARVRGLATDRARAARRERRLRSRPGGLRRRRRRAVLPRPAVALRGVRAAVGPAAHRLRRRPADDRRRETRRGTLRFDVLTQRATAPARGRCPKPDPRAPARPLRVQGHLDGLPGALQVEGRRRSGRARRLSRLRRPAAARARDPRPRQRRDATSSCTPTASRAGSRSTTTTSAATAGAAARSCTRPGVLRSAARRSSSPSGRFLDADRLQGPARRRARQGAGSSSPRASATCATCMPGSSARRFGSASAPRARRDNPRSRSRRGSPTRRRRGRERWA